MTSSESVLESNQIHYEHTMDDIEIENPSINSARTWVISRLYHLKGKDAAALASEFDEWINIPDDMDELDYFAYKQD